MLINLNQPSPALPLIPTGSLIKTNSKFGHELIAGPIVNNKQTVLHKEQGVGIHMEPIDSAAQRYPFTEIIEPVDIQHGLDSWSRMEQQFGRPWTLLDNCQHAARQAYYAEADSPAVTGVVLGTGVSLFLLWLFNRN
jgi:hypothetical protein